MNRPTKYALAFAGALAVGHLATIMAAPRTIMHLALTKMSGGGKVYNQFSFGGRTTSHSRQIVKPSPDLAYSTCVFDLSKGPILVEAAPSPNNGYLSLSVFDARTDNIGVFDSNQYPQGISFVLARAGQATPVGAKVVISPSAKGVILDRRLAPTAELFAGVDKARRADECSPIKG